MTPIRHSPRSSSSTIATTRRASPAVLLVLLLALVAGRTDACTVNVDNRYNVSLEMHTYNAGDGLCDIAYDWYAVDAGRDVGVDCGGNIGCIIKLTEGTDDGGGCDRSVLVGCGDKLTFYYTPNGQEEFSISRRRSLMTEAEVEVEAADDDPAASSSTFGEGVKDVTGSSLRGGAKGSKRIA